MPLPDTVLDRLFDLPLRRLPRLRGRAYHRLAPATFGRGMRIGRGVRFERPSGMRFGPAVIVADGCLFSVKASGASTVPGGEAPLRIGTKTFFNIGCAIAAETSSIEIGDDVLLGPNVVVVTGTHRFSGSAAIARQGMVDGGPVVIGDGAWVAAGAVVLGGTTIAPGSVVAANSVVRGHYPHRVLLAGAPARVVRCLDEGDIREQDNCSERD